MLGVYVLYTNTKHMKVLRLYSLGFLLSWEGLSSMTQFTEEDIAVFFTNNFVAICAELMTHEWVQQSILILQA
jgi:hypothetical protein